MTRLVQVLCAVGVAASALLIANEAAAQRTAVILDFDGRGSGLARRAVVRALSDEVELARSADFESRASDLGADLSSPTGVAQVAGDMGVDLVVRGEVTGRGRRAQTVIRVLDAGGNEVARRQSGSPAGRRGQRRIGAAAVEAVQQAMEELDRRDAEAAANEPADMGGGMGGDLGLGGGLDDELLEEEEEDDEPSEPAAVPYLQLMLGLGGRGRSAEVTLATGGTRGYDAGFYLEIGLWAEARPFAGDDGALKGIFVQGDFFHSIGLSSEEEIGPDMFQEIDSSALRFSFQAGYLIGVGDGELGGGLGYGYDAFSLAENDTMSSTTYSYLRPGVTFRYPLMEQTLGIQADVGLRIVLGTGDLAPFFAESASAFGWDIGLALPGSLDNGLAYALRGGYTSYGLSFEGEADVMANTAEDGSDGYWHVTANVGYEFR